DCLFRACGVSNSRVVMAGKNGQLLMNYSIFGSTPFNALVLAQRLNPAINDGGAVVDGLTFTTAVAPGSIASWFGYQLSDGGIALPSDLFKGGKFSTSWTDPTTGN